MTEWTPEANKAKIRGYWEEVWNNKRTDLVSEYAAAEHKIYLPAGQAHQVVTVQQWLAGAMHAFPDVHFTIDDMIAEGDKVVTRWHYLATHTGDFLGIPPTNKRVTDQGTTTVRLEDGKIVEMWVHQDSLGLLEQLGVIKKPGPEGWGAPQYA